MSDLPPMPHGLPNDPREFQRRLDEIRGALYRKFGPSVRATSAINDSLLRSVAEMRQGRTPTGFWVRVTRRAIDLLRRRQREARAMAAVARDPAAESLDPAAGLAARELFTMLTEALTPAEREVWLLYHDGLADFEIATALNKGIGAVRVALCRARKRVAERLEALRRQEE